MKTKKKFGVFWPKTRVSIDDEWVQVKIRGAGPIKAPTADVERATVTAVGIGNALNLVSAQGTVLASGRPGRLYKVADWINTELAKRRKETTPQ